MSAPAANMRSPPVTTTARAGSLVSSSATDANLDSSSSDSALTFGLFNVTTAMLSSRRSNSTSSSFSGMTSTLVRSGVDTLEHLVRCTPWVDLSIEHIALQRLPPIGATQLLGPQLESTSDDVAQLFAHAELSTLVEHTVVGDETSMRENGIPHLRHALSGGADCSQDRWPPRFRREVGQVEHLLEVAPSFLDTLAVGFVDHEDIGDLHQAGLVRLYGVAPTRVDDDDGGVCLAGDLHLYLPDADGLDEHPLTADRVEQPDRFRRRQRQSTEMTAGRHRADEDTCVGGVVLHAYAVAEDGAAGER